MANIGRIKKEMKVLSESAASGISGGPVNSADLFNWECKISGPAGTPYEGGVWVLTVEFGKQYPYKPPSVQFKTPIYHPNVSEKGEICIPMLKDKWSPALKIMAVLQALQTMLSEPNCDSPQRAELANQYTHNRAQFDKDCAAHTAKFAK